ncbi:MAG: pyridoxal-phosphate dependent enzyme [Pseudomonadota bacterium]
MIDLDPEKPRRLLAACPVYAATPLDRRDGLWVKDETARMGLGAFKALGGVYAVGQLIADRMGRRLPPEEYRSEEVRAVAAGLTFSCASAGNHGMSVAAGAALFGAQARIFLSAQVAQGFADRLAAKGAEVVRVGATYEESVAAAIADAAATGAVHLADGSWPGYTEPPRLVMEGYTVLAEEMREALARDGRWPGRVYLQAGVGGLAAAVAQRIRANWERQPEIVVVEPEAAPCLGASMAAGQLVTVEGPVSGMGRLDCKDASMLAFDILREVADRFVTVSEGAAEDAVRAARGMGYATTPSGAAGLAAALDARADDALVILSEGDV